MKELRHIHPVALLGRPQGLPPAGLVGNLQGHRVFREACARWLRSQRARGRWRGGVGAGRSRAAVAFLTPRGSWCQSGPTCWASSEGSLGQETALTPSVA